MVQAYVRALLPSCLCTTMRKEVMPVLLVKPVLSPLVYITPLPTFTLRCSLSQHMAGHAVRLA